MAQVVSGMWRKGPIPNVAVIGVTQDEVPHILFNSSLPTTMRIKALRTNAIVAKR